MNDAQYYLDHLDALESDSEVLRLIRRIQHDAWRSGMTDAADMLVDIESSDAAWFAGAFKEFILKARDEKKDL